MKPVSAKLTALIHATEDTGKVSRALDAVCPVLMFEQKSETRKFKGHYGNEITTLTVSVRKRSAVPFVEHLLKLLPKEERALLIQDLDRRVDDNGHLYLRLDKQECTRGHLHLMDQDPIKCELSFGIDKADRVNSSDQIKQFLSSIMDQ